VSSTDVAQTLVTLAEWVGGPAIGAAIARGVYRQITGRAARDRARDTSAETQRQKAVTERDRYDSARRKALEYASRLRGDLSEHGLDPGPWPTDLDRTLSREEIKNARRTKEKQ
jgi:hypothetical protein